MSTKETTDIESSDSTGADLSYGSDASRDSKSDPAARDSPETRIQEALRQLEIAEEKLDAREDRDDVLIYHTRGAMRSAERAVGVIEQREDTVGRDGGSA